VSTIWYYADRGQQIGPLTLQDLKQALATLPEPRQVLVWCDTFPDWKRAGDVPELRAQTVVPPPLPQTRVDIASSTGGSVTKRPMNLVRMCFSFSGRMKRAKYWIGFGIAYGMIILALSLWFIIPENVQWSAIVGLWALVWNVALLAVATKRLHDLNISGWWLLGFMVVFALLVGARQQLLTSIASVAMGVAIIWLGSAKGTKGKNRFGSPS
jgi:uncharacterized membrane protein YhaH (DUF805 family)